ncbi:hypothetical protein [Endozoicomonas sp.]|uniref:hypothetical protein n=1 Tax=Endozoicomonas sp. TaxID=1892382 RepID=UPI002887CEE7|nr:hypothetical protein [Endozoicomonas sp.]
MRIPITIVSNTGIFNYKNNETSSIQGQYNDSVPNQEKNKIELSSFIPKEADKGARGVISLLARNITMLGNWSYFWFASQESLDRQLAEAVEAGNSATVGMLLKAGANVNSIQEEVSGLFGCTPNAFSCKRKSVGHHEYAD